MWFGNGRRTGPALVLSGGGAMGALQAGMLRALMRRGFRPSRIVGTSVGALNAAFLAFHPDETGANELAAIWRGLQNQRYVHFNPVRVAYRLASRRLFLFNNDFLQQLVAEHAVIDDFAGTQVPLHVTATNLRTGHKHVFSQGPVSHAVLASTAIPGVFSPVEIDGDAFFDGGIVANLDLETAVDMGAREILAIDLSHTFRLGEPASVIDIVTRTVDIVMRERVERDMAFLSGRAAITLVQPQIDAGPGLGDLRHTELLVERGEAFAERIAHRCFDVKGRLRRGLIRERVDLEEPAGAAR